MNQIQSVGVLYEYGLPGVKFHYQSGQSRTLRDDEAIRFIQLVDTERNRKDIDFLNTRRVRRYVANYYFH
ncbi:hypothetical protein CAP48_10720 [Advenella sp. S44]|uniref:hypothetical protein n=1 Tax=Advenella sp. S44 TaxID=1982755 RepID=UPI000C2A4B23|nr:hypothetical protein [Advenella sp. S44]PJX26448.1 hypothetical protein CAP48_10720 [Advenella sp. S44]